MQYIADLIEFDDFNFSIYSEGILKYEYSCFDFNLKSNINLRIDEYPREDGGVTPVYTPIDKKEFNVTVQDNNVIIS